MSYEIVTFHALPPAQARGADEVESAPDDSGLRLIEMLCRSARRQEAGVAVTVLSDLTTDFGGLEVDATVLRYPLDPAQLMLSRTKAQVAFIEQSTFTRPMAFLDTDILVGRPLMPLFAMPFDIGLTWRRKRKAPLNGGVLFANNRNPESVRRFFRDFLAVYETVYADRKGWWGDQEALNHLVDTAGRRVVEPQFMNIRGTDVLLLPGRTYNHPPHFLRWTLPFARLSKSILHFKGPDRKPYMRPYFEKHLSGPSIQSAGRRPAAAGSHD